jgi:hypothetical protein
MVKKISIFNFQFSKTAKITFVLLVFVFLAVGCQKTSNQQTANQPISQSVNQQTANQPVSNQQSVKPEIKFTHLVVGVDNEAKEFTTLDKTTALEFLNSKFKVETKTFSGVGEYVVAINGLTETTGKNFWAFYVNGKQAKVGAGDYVLQAGDKVEWKLEVIK